MGIFILGILSGLLVLPIIDGLVTIISQLVQVIIYKMEISITKSKAKILELSKELPEEEGNQIGFQTEAIGYEIGSEDDCYE
jgi:hypothetical protein